MSVTQLSKRTQSIICLVAGALGFALFWLTGNAEHGWLAFVGAALAWPPADARGARASAPPARS